jgi:hypothetical protein
MVTRQVMAALARGPDPVLLSMRRRQDQKDEKPHAAHSLARTEVSGNQAKPKSITVSMPGEAQLKFKVQKGKIEAFDITRVELRPGRDVW